MLIHYFKTAYRSLLRNRIFSVINILGLAIGMTAAMLIFLWIQNEMSMDRFHVKAKNIYLIYNRDKQEKGDLVAVSNTPKPLATELKQHYPEVEDVARYRNVTFLLTLGEKHLNTQGAFADSGFLNVFSYPLLKGDPRHALDRSYNIVITQKLAKKFFGNEDALGKEIRIDSVNTCTVTGILKDLPNNTQLNFEYLLPWSYMKRIGWNDNSWTLYSVKTFALLKDKSSETAFDGKIKNIIKDHTKGQANEATTELFTQPLNRAYLYAKSENGKLVGGQINIVIMFGIIGIFILLIACINFMNLSTARSEKRAKEVGVRKVAGASKRSLVFQFLAESILVCTIAFAIALVLTYLTLPWFNTLVAKQLFIPFHNILFWLLSAAFVLLTGILAGCYPAFFLSAFQPVKVLKGTFKKINTLITPRKILVVVQFTVAIFLMISTIVIVKQIKYGLDRNAGYDQHNLVYTFTQGDVPKHFLSIKNELLKSEAVTSLTQSTSPITREWSSSDGYQWDGSTANDAKISFVWLGSDADFVKTLGTKLLTGRDIDIYNYKGDSTSILLNESAVKAMRLKNPVGSIIRSTWDSIPRKVVGVINDFVIDAPFDQNIKPVIVYGPGQSFAQVMHMRLNTNHSAADNLAKIEHVFKKYNPQYPFEYSFADESYALKFKSVQIQEKLAMLFAGLTIFISCLGLFALAAYMAENRRKEIGIRKVLGASSFSITSLLSKEFLKLVGISFLVAAPLAWGVMSQWLMIYSYHVSIQLWWCLIAGVISIVIAFLTVGYQALRAARANPVKSLKTE